MREPDDLLDDEEDFVEDFGLIDSLGRASRILGVAEDAGSAVEGTRSAAAEIRDDIEGVVGAPFLAMDKIDRVREGVGRLTDPRRSKPPGTLETILEIGGMVFGDKK